MVGYASWLEASLLTSHNLWDNGGYLLMITREMPTKASSACFSRSLNISCRALTIIITIANNYYAASTNKGPTIRLKSEAVIRG